MLHKRGLFPIFVVFLIVGLTGAGLLNLKRIEKQQQHYLRHTEMLAISYRAAIHTYRMATEVYLRDNIHKPEVLALFSRAWRSDYAGKLAIRSQLYDLLKKSYHDFWQNYLRQLHFHLPDGESFLRFHQPDRFGDKLFAARPSVRIANTGHRDVTGFEAGRIIDGFRYVAVLDYQGHHIGSVETSIPFKSIQSAMTEYAPGREYQFMVNANLVQERLFPDLKKVYIPSAISDDYLVENPANRKIDIAKPLSPVAQAISERLGRDSDTVRRIAADETFSVGLVHDGTGYVVSFLPIREVSGGRGGYLVCYVKEPLVKSIKHSFMIELVEFAAMLSVALWLLLRWRSSVAELAEQSARRQYEDALLSHQEKIEHKERTRISRELHDGIGQALHTVKLRLKLFLGRIGNERRDERMQIGELIRDVQNTSAELRNLVLSLRPLPLSGMPVDEAVRWMCRNMEKDTGISLLLQISGDFREINDRCSLTIFRVCQEALNNIMKHANASRVQITLQRQGMLIALTIHDNGAGGAASAAGCSGMTIMRERAELAGGRLQIDSPPGEGTRIFMEVPCH